MKLLPFIVDITEEKLGGTARLIKTMGSIRRCSKTWRSSTLLLFQRTGARSPTTRIDTNKAAWITKLSLLLMMV